MEAASKSTVDRELVLSRTVHAPRALVWKACTDPKQIDQWWGPDGFTNKTLSHDLRVGGQWKYTMTYADGTVYPNLVTYTEITPIDRLVYDHGDWENPRMFEGSLTFTDAEEGTVVTIRLLFATKEARDETVERAHAIEGGKQTLARLATYLDNLGHGFSRTH